LYVTENKYDFHNLPFIYSLPSLIIHSFIHTSCCWA